MLSVFNILYSMRIMFGVFNILNQMRIMFSVFNILNQKLVMFSVQYTELNVNYDQCFQYFEPKVNYV